MKHKPAVISTGINNHMTMIASTKIGIQNALRRKYITISIEELLQSGGPGLMDTDMNDGFSNFFMIWG